MKIEELKKTLLKARLDSNPNKLTLDSLIRILGDKYPREHPRMIRMVAVYLDRDWNSDFKQFEESSRNIIKVMEERIMLDPSQQQNIVEG